MYTSILFLEYRGGPQRPLQVRLLGFKNMGSGDTGGAKGPKVRISQAPGPRATKGFTPRAVGGRRG